MTKAAVEHIFTGPTAPIASYDKTKTCLGTLMRQLSLGGSPSDKFVGPSPLGVARVGDQSTAIASQFVHVIATTADEHIVFYAENTTAAATRRIGAYRHTISTGVVTWLGFITLTFANSQTVRGFRVLRDLYTTGTVEVSGTSVTGTGTSWVTDRLAAGARIGFGSTDPAAISTWYDISAIGGDGSITLSSSAGSITAGTSYVIEEVRVVVACTSSTATNGGLFLAKGLHLGLFITTGTTVAAATSVDNIRAVYWLADAGTVTNDVIGGVGVEDRADWQTQHAYCTEGSGTSLLIYKYNLRAALSGLASAKSTSAFVLATGAQVVSGNISQSNNGRVGTLNHGAGSGVLSFYFVTTTRVYRVALTNITSGSTTFISDLMVEIPPGGTGTMGATGALAQLEISSTLDRLYIATTTAKAYLTRYYTDSTPFDRQLVADDRVLNAASADSGVPVAVSLSAGTILAPWIEGGILYLSRGSTSTASCQIYIVPLAADWEFAAGNNQRVITPELQTPGAVKYYRLYIANMERVGSELFGKATQPFRAYYRTAGIDDNSGAWTAIDLAGTLEGIAAASSIQFMFEFRIAGDFAIPARINSLALVYDAEDSLPAELRWNLNDSDNSDGTVGFTQEEVFGSGLPVFTATYRRVDNDAIVLVQDSSNTDDGVFEYWNGSSWVAGLSTNTVGVRRRFRPTAGLPTGVDVYAKITV